MVFKLAIFASGSGSNAEKIIQYFKKHHNIKVSLLLSNKPNAGALEKAANHQVACHVFNKDEFYNTDQITQTLLDLDINLIILAGFLWLVPDNLIKLYKNRIINIHPALLPKYGGKGMYGHHVHQAVYDNKEIESGITIHLVNEEYDKGEILLQQKVKLDDSDTPESISKKVLQIEHEYFAPTIEKYVNNLMTD